MQFKVLVSTLLIAAPFSTVLAQKGNQPLVIGANNSKVIVTDSIVKKSPVPAPAIVVSQFGKKSVPLAGEKSYFGSMNGFVEDYTRKYMSRNNRTLSVVQGRSLKQFSLMENVLEKHEIPKQLKYLAVIESALNNNAKSGVGALGPWQLMETTARMMGLTVNTKRDDRTDWFKSTDAAAKYLSYLYEQLDDWLLVVAAYNSGPTPVLRAIKNTGSHNFWEIKKYLPKETQGHVMAFIATASIFENMSDYIASGDIPGDFKFSKEAAVAIESAKPASKVAFTDDELKSMAIVRINDPVSMELLAQDLKIERKLLEKWNPDYDEYIFKTNKPEYYSLRIPKEKLDNFIERKDFITRKSKIIFDDMRL